MKITDGWKITIVNALGHEVSGGFEVPDDATRDDADNDELMQKFGKNMLNEYFDCKDKVKEFEQKMLDNCDCFWKDQSEVERSINRCHSSECATWEL